jgi:DNA-binding SARP family transcriptional activator
VTEGPLSIRLLGQFQVLRGDAPVPLDSARAESVLAFLLLHRHEPQPRQRVAFALWPDSTEAQAMTNLRHVLHTLRH